MNDASVEERKPQVVFSFEAHQRAMAAGLIQGLADLSRKDDMVGVALLGSVLMHGNDGKTHARTLYFGALSPHAVMSSVAHILAWASNVEAERLVNPRFAGGDLAHDDGVVRCVNCEGGDPTGDHAEQERVQNGKRLLSVIKRMFDEGGLYHGVASEMLLAHLERETLDVDPDKDVS